MTGRAFLTWQILDATMRMQATPDPAAKLKWAKVLNEARRARGDFAHIESVQPEPIDQAGERPA